MQAQRARAGGFGDAALFGAGAVVVCVAVLSVGAALVGAVTGNVREATAPEPTIGVFSWAALGSTIGYCTLIAVIATALAVPVGWAIGRGGARGRLSGAMALVPLMLPNYLAYAGWGALRGPGTAIGDWLAGCTPEVNVLAGRVTAVMGLALWSWPLAAVAVAVVAARTPGDLVDALRMEPVGRFRRAWETLRLVRSGCVVGFLAVWCVSAGSAVPLHLAQVQTLAIHLWSYMSLTSEPVRAWRGGWVLVGLAVAGGIGLVRVVGREASNGRIGGDGEREEERIGWGAWMWVAVVWGVSVAGPLVVQGVVLRDWGSVWAFIETSRGGMLESAQTAGWVGAICGLLCLSVWRLGSERRVGWAQGVTAGSVGVFGASALTPGVLVGSGVGALVNAAWCPAWVGGTTAPVIAAHVARFGVLACVVGWWLAGRESEEERSAREVYAWGTWGWVRTQVMGARGVWAVVGVGIASAMLSAHEIETTVQLSPPGLGNLAQRLLDLLHYARDEQLSAASVLLLGSGTLVALATGLAGTGWVRGPGMGADGNEKDRFR